MGEETWKEIRIQMKTVEETHLDQFLGGGSEGMWSVRTWSQVELELQV